eukprot:6120881-Pyramimonas_sp.AAC.1
MPNRLRCNAQVFRVQSPTVSCAMPSVSGAMLNISRAMPMPFGRIAHVFWVQCPCLAGAMLKSAGCNAEARGCNARAFLGALPSAARAIEHESGVAPIRSDALPVW